MLRLEGPSKAPQPTFSLRAGPLTLSLPERKGIFPPTMTRVLRAECDGEAGLWQGGSSPFTSMSGRANWKEPPLPGEHHRPGLTRRVLLQHSYTPWVPLTAWDRYSWSDGACPIMSSCHGAWQAPPLPAAAAVLEHSSGEGWLIPGRMGGCRWLPSALEVHRALPYHGTLITSSVRCLQREPSAPRQLREMFDEAISGPLCRYGGYPGMAVPLLS